MAGAHAVTFDRPAAWFGRVSLAARAALAALCALLPAFALGAQVSTIAATPPTLSPVGIWQATTNAAAGPSAAANTLSIRINSGATQHLPTLTDNAINRFPSPVNVTTQWDLATLISAVDLVGYFASPTAALSATGSDIPSSRVQGRMLSGRVSSFASFSGAAVSAVGTPGATLHLFRQLIIAPINGVGQRTDNLDLQLDLRGMPNLPAGTYRGTLTLRAIAY